tara:strand:+ start:2732 stop:3547 length:816 start_codon:yes stop_codon:yes gene_type:complete
VAQDIKKTAYSDLPKLTSMYDSFRSYVGEKLITVKHMPSGQSVAFNSGIVDDFSDSFRSNWSSEETYGRMDQIANYSNTTRAISVRLILIAEGPKQAVRNMAQLGKMSQFMYPAYEAGVIKDRPLLSVKLLNLIQDTSTGGGLLGYITTLNNAFDLKEGVFEVTDSAGDEQGQLFLYPKYLTINFDFTPYHAQRLGFDSTPESTQGSFAYFPYGSAEANAAIESNPDSDIQAAPNSSAAAAQEYESAVATAAADEILKEQDTGGESGFFDE